MTTPRLPTREFTCRNSCGALCVADDSDLYTAHLSLLALSEWNDAARAGYLPAGSCWRLTNAHRRRALGSWYPLREVVITRGLFAFDREHGEMLAGAHWVPVSREAIRTARAAMKRIRREDR